MLCRFFYYIFFVHNLNQFVKRNTEAYVDYYIFHPLILNAADWYIPFEKMVIKRPRF